MSSRYPGHLGNTHSPQSQEDALCPLSMFLATGPGLTLMDSSGLRIQWRRLVHNPSPGLALGVAHSPASGVCLHCSFYSQLAGHGVRTEGVNVVEDAAAFHFGLMVVPLISLGKEGEGYVLDQGRGKVMMVTADILCLWAPGEVFW